MSGNLKDAEVRKKPSDLDPATAHAAIEQAEEFGYRVRDLIDRGHKPRHAIVIALKNAGMYELLKARRGAMERIFAYFEGEVDRLKQKLDEGARIVRGVPIVKVGRPDEKPDPVLYAVDGSILKKVSGE